MPQNFPEIWVNRVEYTLKSSDQAPFLQGISELDVAVDEIAGGSMSEQNTIHIPTTDFEVDILLNNTTYPIALQAYTDSAVTINLDKYQSKVVTLSDDQIIGASYAKIDAVTFTLVRSMLIKKYGKAIHALAPNGNTALTPVIVATGPAKNGRTTLIYDDLVNLKEQCDAMQIPAQGRRLVLCSDHYNDMLLDRKYFGNLLVDYKAGQVAPTIAGFELMQYIANPYFAGTNKLPYGAMPVAGANFQASVLFYVPNVALKTGMTKQYYTNALIDPENQMNKLSYRHYFICVPKTNRYIGAITSGLAA